MKRIFFVGCIIFHCMFSSVVSAGPLNTGKNEVLINDVSRLNQTSVREIYKALDEDGIRNKLLEAARLNLKVSMAGQRHSQGGHQFSQDGIVLDMLSFNKILSLDQKNKVLTVQIGATWDQIQRYINPFNLSIKVMQTSNIFTVGGSMSLNIHGRDPNFSTIRDSIRSFRLMRADGKIVNVNRDENAELFNLVIGGMGLFGVILDVDIELSDNVTYEKKVQYMDYQQYPEFFEQNIRNNELVGLHGAALSIAPGKRFMKEMSETTYLKSDQVLNSAVLGEEENVFRNKFLLDLSRKYAWGKKLRWFLQKKLIDESNQNKPVSRNNAMREPIKFLEYYSKQDTDILQEYFIPKENFISFIDGLREIIVKEKINLIHAGVRYLPKDNESMLSYAQNDSFSVVLYINQKISDEEINRAKEWTRKIVDLALDNQGSYYLAYQVYPSKEQLVRAYPKFDEFVKKKNLYDSAGLFRNKFEEYYRR